jgi:uncharacterized protein
MKRALVVWGGLETHEPEAGAEIVRGLLEPEGFEVDVTADYAALGAPDVARYDLVVPQITAGEIDDKAVHTLSNAIRLGTGIAGFHYGLATSFRSSFHFHFIIGSTFVGHPGGVIDYRVDVTRPDDPVMAGIPSFDHTSEQYYLHVDPAVEVLATTTFSGEHASWRRNVTMPVVYKTTHGKGRVFYSALGHKPQELDRPEIRTILQRGLLWAAR